MIGSESLNTAILFVTEVELRMGETNDSIETVYSEMLVLVGVNLRRVGRPFSKGDSCHIASGASHTKLWG